MERKKEQKEWLDNTLPDPHPCTAGIKEEEHIYFPQVRAYLAQRLFSPLLSMQFQTRVKCKFDQFAMILLNAAVDNFFWLFL